MPLHPICEAVDLSMEASIFIDKVRWPSSSKAPDQLLHFHDVSEMVLFEKVEGWFLAGGCRYPLVGRSVIFVPSMMSHDFALAPGEKAWRLIQIDPYLVERLSAQGNGARLAQVFCVRPDPDAFARLIMLADWLQGLAATDPADPQIPRITELVLLAAINTPALENGQESGGGEALVERLRPAIELIRKRFSPGVTLEQAATCCHLSPSYFSRQFKNIFGMSFTEYARTYRLHVAARRLVSTREPLSLIAHQLGFSSASHFAFRFHQRFGLTPRAYRQGFRQPCDDTRAA
jgi:AraC-like DNA-binding protein